MIVVLSPAKKLDFVNPVHVTENTVPRFLDHSSALITVLREYDPTQLASLMRLSDELAALNVSRYARWNIEHALSESRQAAFAFNGAVYEAFDPVTLSNNALAFAQTHLRILSGLYGVLRPLDLVQAHRLEMGTRLPTSRGTNLYDFWGDIVTNTLNSDLRSASSSVLLNLASEEYFKVVRPDHLSTQFITPVFEEVKDGKARVIAVHAKKARGLMARFIVTNGIRNVEEIKNFDGGGYSYDQSASDNFVWRFRRHATLQKT